MVDSKYVKPGFGQALSHFIEEMGECLSAAGKTQRHGPFSSNPELPPEDRESNVAWLAREMDDLEGAISRLRAEMLGLHRIEALKQPTHR